MSRTCFAGSPPVERRPRYRPELLHCVCGFLSALFHAVGCLVGGFRGGMTGFLRRGLGRVAGVLGGVFGGVSCFVSGFRGCVGGLLRSLLGRVAGVLSRLLDVATYILTVSKRGEGEHSQRKFQFHGSSRSEF